MKLFLWSLLGMDSEREFKSIDDVQLFLRGVPSISQGGCGFAALVMYDYLKAKGVDAEIVYAYGFCDPEYDNNISVIQNGSGELCACQHAMIRVKDSFYDCKGECDIEMYYDHHTISRELVVKSLDSGRWNSSFDRHKYVPMIEKAIGYNIKLGCLQN